QREESLGHTGNVELAFANLLDVAHLEVGDQARGDGTTERAQALGLEKAQKADAPLAEQDQHCAPAHPAEHHPAADASVLLALDLLQLVELALLFGRDEQPQLAGCLSHYSSLKRVNRGAPGAGPRATSGSFAGRGKTCRRWSARRTP